MQTTVQRRLELISRIFKYSYIVHIILAGNTLLMDSLIMRITPFVVLILGAVVLLYRLWNLKTIIRYPLAIMYMVFLSLYCISSLINIKYGFIENVKITIWMTLQFGALYVFDINRKYNDVVKEMKVSLLLIIGLTTLSNLIGFVMLLANYFGNYSSKDGRTFLMGVAWWGRLYGIHTDPNYGCILSVIAFMAALYLLRELKKRRSKAVLVFTMLLQMIAIAYSASRTGLVTICVSLAIYFFINGIKRNKKIYKAVLVALCSVVLTICINNLLVKGYNIYVKQDFAKKIASFLSGKQTGEKDDLTEIGREEEIAGDISNRRFDLWKNALQITKTAPVTGISFGNIVKYAQEEVPDSYLLTNGFLIFNAFHNMFMDLLVSQGLIGFIVFILIIIFSLKYLILNYKNIPEEIQETCIFLFSICSGVLVSSLFVSEILYVNNQTTVLFWMLWGFLIYFFKSKEGKDIECISGIHD